MRSIIILCEVGLWRYCMATRCGGACVLFVFASIDVCQNVCIYVCTATRVAGNVQLLYYATRHPTVHTMSAVFCMHVYNTPFLSSGSCWSSTFLWNSTSVFVRISKSPAYSICTIRPSFLFRQAHQPTVTGTSADTPAFSLRLLLRFFYPPHNFFIIMRSYFMLL